MIIRVLLQAVFNSIPERNLEETTLSGMRIHERHLYFGMNFEVSQLTPQHLQEHASKRRKGLVKFPQDSKWFQGKETSIPQDLHDFLDIIGYERMTIEDARRSLRQASNALFQDPWENYRKIMNVD